MVRLLSRVIGRHRDGGYAGAGDPVAEASRSKRAVARYAGLTGSPDESCFEKAERRACQGGNARVRRGLIQLAWRFLIFQKDVAGAVVSHTDRGSERRAQDDNDRGTGAGSC